MTVSPAAGQAAPKVVPVALKVTALPPVILRGPHPGLTLTLRLSKPTRLTLTLRDAKGRILATWRRQVKAGTRHLTLALPPKARRAGRDRLHLVWAGGAARTLPLVVRAPTSRRHAR